eukprot:2644321-Rhodomonas_salina.3
MKKSVSEKKGRNVGQGQTQFRERKAVGPEQISSLDAAADENGQSVYSLSASDAVKSADLGNQMRLVKFFKGEFKNYIDTILDLNIKLTLLNQVQPEERLVNEILQHMLVWTMNHKESPSVNSWSNFINTFNKDSTDPARYTMVLLESERKAKEHDIQNAQAIAVTLNKVGRKCQLAAMQASGSGDSNPIYCEDCEDTFMMHCTYCHSYNHFKLTCNCWCHYVKNSSDSSGSSCRKGRGRG